MTDKGANFLTKSRERVDFCRCLEKIRRPSRNFIHKTYGLSSRYEDRIWGMGKRKAYRGYTENRPIDEGIKWEIILGR